MNQRTRLLSYLEEHKTINSFEGLTKLGIWRVPNRVSELRKQGHNISSEIITYKNKFGESTQIAQYTLEES